MGGKSEEVGWGLLEKTNFPAEEFLTQHAIFGALFEDVL